jgi:hypothetical protein
MLTPAETADFDLFASALGRPLVAFVDAEYRAAQRMKEGTKVHLKDLDPLGSKFHAELCAA